jgi:hypothetical protein
VATDDPLALVERLDPETLRERIRELDRQRRALAVLLRAAVARERTLARPPAVTGPAHEKPQP